METLEEKLKQFEHTKAEGNGYPKNYKNKINAYMEGFNSGRFNEYQKECFVEAHQKANEMLATYNRLIKKDWKTAKEMAVNALLDIETEIKKSQLLYGETGETEILEAKKSVLYFICWSLPVIKREVNG